jgi:hypothetical protein
MISSVDEHQCSAVPLQTRLFSLAIDLSVLDSVATESDFSIGVAGTISDPDSDFSTVSLRDSDDTVFSTPSNGRMLEIFVSENLFQSLLRHAHKFLSVSCSRCVSL